MTEFLKLRFKELRKDEVIAFGPDLVKIITPFDPAALGIDAPLNALKTQWEKLDPFMKDASGSVLTDDIAELDALRDSDLVGIKSFAKAMLYHRNPAKRAAAERVLAAMDGFDKNIPRQSLAVQTKTVVELVKRFETEAGLMADLALIGLTEWIAPMKATNTEVGDKYLDRTREDSDKPDTNFLEQRPLAEAALLHLFKVIMAKNTLAPDPQLDQLTAQTNELIAKYNQLVAQRKGKGGKEDSPAPVG